MYLGAYTVGKNTFRIICHFHRGLAAKNEKGTTLYYQAGKIFPTQNGIPA